MVHYKFIDQCMLQNDELTTRNLHEKLLEAYPGLMSIETVRRAHSKLGWVSTTPKYCQLIREINKEKRLKWCNELDENDTFDDIVWTDE